MGFTRSEAALVTTASALVFSRIFGLSIVLPDFRHHYEPAFAVDLVWIGVAFGAYGLTMALTQLPSGWLSDRFGRRPILLGATILFVAGSVAAAYTESVWTLIGARLMQGLGAVGSVAMAGVGERIAPERRTMAMALVGIPAGVGFLLGMGIGPALYPRIGMSGLFLVTAGVGLAAGLPVLGVRFATAAQRPEAQPGRVARPIIGFAFGGFVTSWFLTTTMFFLPPTDWTRLLPMLAVALVAVGLVGRLADRAGWTWQPAGVALIGVAAAAPILVFGGQVGGLLAGMAFFAAHAVLSSTIPSQVSRIAGPHGGRGHGIQNVVTYLGTFVAGPVAGILAHAAGLAFAVAAGLALAATAFLAFSLRRPAPAAIAATA